MKTLTLNGVEYKLPNSENAVVAQKFLEWAKAKLDKGRSPLDILRDKIAGYPPEVQAMLVKEALALERTPLAFGSPEVEALLRTIEGGYEITRLLWQYYQPDLTPEQCWELHQQAVTEHGETYSR